MEVVVTTGAIRCAKLQSDHYHQQTNIQFFTGWMPFLSPNEQCQSIEGKISHSMDLLTPNSTGVFQLCLWPLIAPGYLVGGLPCLSSALWSQYHNYKNVSIVDFIGTKGYGDGGNNWSYMTCKAPVRMSPPTNQHPVFSTGRTPFLSPNQHCQYYCQSTEGKYKTSNA